MHGMSKSGPTPKVPSLARRNSQNGIDAPRDSAPLPLAIKMEPLAKLKPSPRNARTHSKKQIRQIANSMLRFGVTQPLLIDERGQIVAGHARAEAARLIGLRSLPVVRLSHLGEAEVRAYMLADNKIAQNAGWDRERLAAELEELEVSLPDVGLD